MSYMQADTEFDAIKALELITREREMSLSTREWKHRLAGYGYSIRDTDHGPVVAMLLGGHELCDLPERLH